MLDKFSKKESPILGILGLGGGIARAAGGADPIDASGGSKTFSGSYTIHTFSYPTSDNFVVNSGEGECDILVIAGGGAGGSGGVAGWYGGGGGAGGYAYATGYSVAPGTYPISVGNGGSGNAGTRGSSGANSFFNLSGGSANSIFCQGGGGGGDGQYPGISPDAPGYDGGNGGGSGSHLDSSSSTPGGSAVQPAQNPGFSNGTLEQYGYAGGNEAGGTGDGRGGGGGGAGAAGQNSPGPTPLNGRGGAGRENSISGSPVTYAVGAPTYEGDPQPSTSGSGGPGKAGGAAGGSGQAGVVIVRYLT